MGEWQNYAHLNVQQAEKAMTKANELMTTESIKKMFAQSPNPYDKRASLHYGIEVGDALSLWHILSLIFYCDFSKLCTDFSSSFRALKPFETLRNIKKRNAMYYWMSRYLRELVELFGQSSYGEKNPNTLLWSKDRLSKISGPFFT